MADFDLIGRLLAPAAAAARARAMAAAIGPDGPADPALAEAAEQAEASHRASAQQVLADRIERSRPFVKRHQEHAASYKASPALTTAANVALSLGRPLLLTGQPGSGKTLAAFWLAHILGLGSVFEFHVKSESRARDLLYTFDAVSWFRMSQLGDGVVDKAAYLKPGPLGRAFGWDNEGPRSSVVLIDEVDKAPRDFPNDLLLELDQMRFLVEETGRWVECPLDQRPVVVITSNAERQLPPPFLRRCIVHEIRLDGTMVGDILKERLAGTASESLVAAAGHFWEELGRRSAVRRLTIDEYWRWLALETGYGQATPEQLVAALRHRRAEHLLFARTVFSDADYNAVFGPA